MRVQTFSSIVAVHVFPFVNCRRSNHVHLSLRGEGSRADEVDKTYDNGVW